MARERLRLFFALCPPPAVRRQLAEVLAGLPADAGKAVAVENLHLTLAFLGAVERPLLAPLCDGAAGLDCPAFELRLNRSGLWRKSGIFWLAPSETPPALAVLAARLRELAEGLGIALEQRDYQPHLTLLRKARRAPEPAFRPIDWAVGEFALLESVTRASGPEYRVLASWPLTGSEN